MNTKQDRMVIMAEENTVYTPIDIEGLATSLAEDTWKEETKEVHTDNLYNMVVDSEIGIKREVAPYWASIFFNIRERYKKVIEQYQRDEYDTNQEER